jgi:hypothetical protein
MLGTYSYHEVIRKTIISFGTLFNQIYIKHQEEDGSDASLIKVPIAYGPVQKFLARLEQRPDLKKRVSLTLPRMSFELTSLQYDSSRKVSTMQTFKAIRKDGSGQQIKTFMPVPYNIGIQLNIISKYNDDMLQIIEQILPIFQPHFNLTVDLASTIGEKRDIPMIMDNIQMNDNYEGSFEERRSLVYSLNFTAKTYLFGPIANSTDGLIKKVQIDYATSTANIRESSRQLRYVATPRALKDYNDDSATTLAENITETSTKITVSDGSALVNESYIMINDELIYIKNIEGNIITVRRGEDGTSPSIHYEGNVINAVNAQDDELIEFGDDFGFNEETFDFGDGRVYSTTKNIDVSL